MPENQAAYLNTNGGTDFSPKKRQFSRRNQHYLSHLATYDLETMMAEIEKKSSPQNDVTPYLDPETNFPLPLHPPLHQTRILRNSSESPSVARNNFAAAGLRTLNNPYMNPTKPKIEK
jgi:hypothetical protein